MTILLLADIPGWIVDRLCARMVTEMPEIEWKAGYYGCMTTDEILAAAADCDMIHHANWDIERHWPRIMEAGKPILMSVRSHRFPPYVREVAGKIRVHVVNRGLLADFPDAAYIPDGLMVEPASLRVGFAGKPGAYKGTDLIEQACREIGAEFWPATDMHPFEMMTWFRDIDVYCCNSQAEGFSTPVMEALALNKPVVSTRVGLPWFDQLAGVSWVERSVEGIKAGLLKHWPSRNLDAYTWPVVADQFRALYREVAA